MKSILFLLTAMFSFSSFSASWDELQVKAERKYIGKTTVEGRFGVLKQTDKKFKFRDKINHVEINRIDNPFISWIGYGVDAIEAVTYSDLDIDHVEIFISSPSQTINCIAVVDSYIDLNYCREI